MNHRRQALALIAATLLVPLPKAGVAATLGENLGGLFSGPKGRLSVLLVDTTGSIAADDWQLYERAAKSLFETARPGDRIVIARVSDRPASRFLAHADHSFTAQGNSMHDQVRARHVRTAALADFGALRSDKAGGASATLLLDAVMASGEFLAQGRSRGQSLQLLVLSDMIEESPVVNFAREAVTPALASRVIDGQRARRLLPDLAGVQVHVVGAGGRDAAHMARVRDFWLAYFAATGAKVQGYGRAVGTLSP